MPTPQFPYGSDVPVRLVFEDEDGAPVDPDTVTALLSDRQGQIAETPVTVTRASEGVWTGWVSAPASGSWVVQGTGAFIGPPAYTLTVEEPFDVKSSVFA
jgi:hypothetical protein